VWRVGGQPSEAVHYRLNADGTEPDLAEERRIIEVMEAGAIARRLKSAANAAAQG
jgi:hypothetical protein